MSIDLSRYDFVVFDCDGVILDSNNLKTGIFSKALADEPPAAVKKLVDYHLANAGVSRYEKLRLFYEEMNPVPDRQARIDRALARFGELSKQGLLECDVVPGALDYVKAAKAKGLRLFVASGSDEKELVEVFQARGLAPFFERILGSPASKTDNTKKIVSLVGPGRKGVFFGDAKSDVEAAQANGLDFVFVSGTSSWKDGEATARRLGAPVIRDFRELGERVK